MTEQTELVEQSLLDEIAEAISDTLDMDWQPSWAAPNIIAIINRERRMAREEGAKAVHASVTAELDRCCEPCPQCRDAIANLDPAQIAGGGE
jgi:hypothetical protein